MTVLLPITLWIWVIFWMYWLVAAFSAKKMVRQNFSQLAGVRLVIFVVALVVIRFSTNQTYNVHAERIVHHHLWIIRLFGFALFLIGLGIAVWARIHMDKNWGMPMTVKQRPELVTSGPYKYVRHPIYAGLLLAIYGTALVANLLWLIVLFLLACYFLYAAVVEERLLVKEFPQAYPAYKKRTKMLIPYIF